MVPIETIQIGEYFKTVDREIYLKVWDISPDIDDIIDGTDDGYYATAAFNMELKQIKKWENNEEMEYVYRVKHIIFEDAGENSMIEQYEMLELYDTSEVDIGDI